MSNSSKTFGDLKVKPFGTGSYDEKDKEILNRVDAGFQRLESGKTKFVDNSGDPVLYPGHLVTDTELYIATDSAIQYVKMVLDDTDAGLPYVDVTVATGKTLRVFFLNGESAADYTLVMASGEAAVALADGVITFTVANDSTSVTVLRNLILANADLKHLIALKLTGTTVVGDTFTVAQMLPLAATAPTNATNWNSELEVTVAGVQVPIFEIEANSITAYVAAYAVAATNAAYVVKGYLENDTKKGLVDVALTYFGETRHHPVLFRTSLEGSGTGDDLGSVIAIVANEAALPGAPSEGDRYLQTDTTAIRTYTGSVWDIYLPDEGDQVFDEDTNVLFIFTTAWVDASTLVTHNSMLGLQGGDGEASQYYHLNLVQHTQAVNGLLDGTPTSVDMANAAHALVMGAITGDGSDTQVVNNLVLCDPNIGGAGSVALTLPAVANFAGFLYIYNTGLALEDITIDDAASQIVKPGEFYVAFSTGAAWVSYGFFYPSAAQYAAVRDLLTSATTVAGAKLVLAEGTDNGTFAVTLQAPADLTQDCTITIPDAAAVDLGGIVTATDHISADGSSHGDVAANTALTAMLTAAGAAGAKLELLEATGAEDHKVIFQAPTILTQDCTITVPDAAAVDLGGIVTATDHISADGSSHGDVAANTALTAEFNRTALDAVITYPGGAKTSDLQLDVQLQSADGSALTGLGPFLFGIEVSSGPYAPAPVAGTYAITATGTSAVVNGAAGPTTLVKTDVNGLFTGTINFTDGADQGTYAVCLNSTRVDALASACILRAAVPVLGTITGA